jgi:hypothetical protein
MKKVSNANSELYENYRSMSQKLKSDGIDVNHSSIRNYVLNFMETVACDLCKTFDVKIKHKDLKKIAKQADFQDFVFEYISMIEQSKKKENDQ